jgi:hypothetical protein
MRYSKPSAYACADRRTRPSCEPVPIPAVTAMVSRGDGRALARCHQPVRSITALRATSDVGRSASLVAAVPFTLHFRAARLTGQ